MTTRTLLKINLAIAGAQDQTGPASWNVVDGGSEALIRWLEARLGLGGEPVAVTTRITQFAARLAAVAGSAWAASLEVDRWATAKELLSRRDQLRLAGWTGNDDPRLPPLVRDLSKAEASGLPLAAGTAERIGAILAALDDGQRLPAHEIELSPDAADWPGGWRALLSRLELRPAPDDGGPLGKKGTFLRVAQDALGGNLEPVIGFDKSFQWIEAAGPGTAVDVVASLLAALPPAELAECAVVCGSAELSIALDAALARRGVATGGAETSTPFHPAIQVLPLALALLREPVDPDELLAFLTLPIGPVPRRAGTPLSEALAQQPGLGSRKWVEAFDKITSPKYDPDGKLRPELERWLTPARTRRDRPLPSDAVAAVARRVASWAMGRAMFEDRDGDEDLALALRTVASQASSFAELVETQGTSIDEPQRARLLDAVEAGGLPGRPHPPAAGGPLLTSSLAGIRRPVQLLIWLGLGATDGGATRWTRGELDAIHAAGLALDDGSAELSRARSAEIRGFALVRDRMLAVSLGSAGKERPHPTWLRLAALLLDSKRETLKPKKLEAILRGEAKNDLAPWAIRAESNRIELSPAARTNWPIDPALFRELDHVSATSLEARLSCPLKWVLTYQAHVESTPIARLPEGGRLRGTFLHAVLETVLGKSAGGDLPPIGELVDAVGLEFDARLPLDAAPLDALSLRSDKARLREELLASVRTLHDALGRGGYRIVGLEMEVEGEVLGKSLRGYIDCLARTDDGEEAIIDFKYGGPKRWREKLETGRSTQLATYAAARAGVAGHSRVRAAYLALAGAALVTPEGGPIRNADAASQVAGAPDILDVWKNFEAALAAADGWFTGKEPVTARPLLSPDKWPAGSEIVLGDPEAQGDPPACEYCDFPVLCGRSEVQ